MQLTSNYNCLGLCYILIPLNITKVFDTLNHIIVLHWFEKKTLFLHCSIYITKIKQNPSTSSYQPGTTLYGEGNKMPLQDSRHQNWWTTRTEFCCVSFPLFVAGVGMYAKTETAEKVRVRSSVVSHAKECRTHKGDGNV